MHILYAQAHLIEYEAAIKFWAAHPIYHLLEPRLGALPLPYQG